MWATIADLKATADLYGIQAPIREVEQVQLLQLATADIDRALGAVHDPDELSADQLAALKQATTAQAVFRQAQGPQLALGLEDGLASVGPLNLSIRQAPRVSPEALELLAGHDLLRRSGTVPWTPVAEDPCVRP